MKLRQAKKIALCYFFRDDWPRTKTWWQAVKICRRHSDEHYTLMESKMMEDSMSGRGPLADSKPKINIVWVDPEVFLDPERGPACSKYLDDLNADFNKGD